MIIFGPFFFKNNNYDIIIVFKKIRVGLAGGIGGGQGDHTELGDTQGTVEGSESSFNTTSETPVVPDPEDPCD